MMPADPGAIETVYLDGRFLAVDEARISPLDRGFLYGDGVFTTMRAEQGQVLYLSDHLERVHQSLQDLRLSLPPTIEWNEVLEELLRRNGLEAQVASIKVVITRGRSSLPGLPRTGQSTLVVYAWPYSPPHPAARREGYRLRIAHEGFAPPLSRLKSLNYLYCLAARQAALDEDADDAVLLDCQGRVSETTIGSLLLRTHGRWWTPDSPFQLPGITLRGVMKILEEEGHGVVRRSARTADLFLAETIWVLNSLMGIMPVSRLDRHSVTDPALEEAGRLKEQFFARGRRRGNAVESRKSP